MKTKMTIVRNRCAVGQKLQLADLHRAFQRGAVLLERREKGQNFTDEERRQKSRRFNRKWRKTAKFQERSGKSLTFPKGKEDLDPSAINLSFVCSVTPKNDIQAI